MKLQAAIIDDERLARQELKSVLADIAEVEVVAEFANAEEAIEGISNSKLDLLFLDIQMPEKTGFDLLEELDAVPEVIFVTAYDEYALKAFEVNALDYILKPVETERLKAAIAKVQKRILERAEEEQSETTQDVLGEEDQVFLKDGDKCWFVRLGDIRLFESEGNYVRVLFKNYKPLILKSLNNLDKKLSDKAFFRANRKHIINLKWIEGIEPWFNGGLLVTLKGGDKIEISRRQAVKLKDKMSL